MMKFTKCLLTAIVTLTFFFIISNFLRSESCCDPRLAFSFKSYYPCLLNTEIAYMHQHHARMPTIIQ